MGLIGAAFSRRNSNNLHFLSRLTAVKDAPPDDWVSRTEHETTREQLEGEVNHLTQLLQGALRKQDEMALEAADAWQKVRKKRSQREGKSRGPQETDRLLRLRITLDLSSAHQARDNRAEREALQELVMTRETENQTLTSRLAESKDAVSQLKQLVENHVASEREKNKRVSGRRDEDHYCGTGHQTGLNRRRSVSSVVTTRLMSVPVRSTTCRGRWGS